jgi:ABC-type transport system involved in multi-copper enzyme maturation permease subunit
MTSLLAIVRREIVERRMAFVAAAVASVLPLIARWAPLPIAGSRGLVTFMLMATLVVGFGGALAIVLGATMIGRDLAERRMSFYLSRPIPAAAVWFGKLLGSVLISFCSAAIVIIPTAVLAPDAWRGNWTISAGATTAGLALSALILVLVAHVMGTMIRSRSPWVLADLAAAVVFAACCGLVVHDAWRAQAPITVAVETSAIVAAALLVALAAGALQLRYGRTDIGRNHRALSLSLWSGMAIVVMLTLAWGMWVRSPALRDLRATSVSAPASGPWIAMSGLARGRADYPAVILLNTTSRSTLRVRRDSPFWQPEFRFSRDGRHVIWVESSDPVGSMIGVADLGSAARSHRFAAPNLSNLKNLAISPDGTRVAILADNILAVFETAEGRSIAAFHVDEGLTNGRRTPQTSEILLSFADADHLRLYRAPADRALTSAPRFVTIDEFDLRGRRVSRTGAFEVFSSEIRMSVSPEGRLLVTIFNVDRNAKETQRRLVLDGRDGSVLREVAGGVRILADGALTYLQRRDGLLFLVVQRNTTRTIRLGAAVNAFLAPSIGPGTITVFMRHPSSDSLRLVETVLIDETTGRITCRLVDCYPVAWFNSGWLDPLQPQLSASLFYKVAKRADTEEDRLLRYDAGSGRTVVLAGR